MIEAKDASNVLQTSFDIDQIWSGPEGIHWWNMKNVHYTDIVNDWLKAYHFVFIIGMMVISKACKKWCS